MAANHAHQPALSRIERGHRGHAVSCTCGRVQGGMQRGLDMTRGHIQLACSIEDRVGEGRECGRECMGGKITQR